MLQFRPYLIRRRVTRRLSTVSCHVFTEGLPTRIKQETHGHRTRHLREERPKNRGDTEAEWKGHMLLEKHGRERERKKSLCQRHPMEVQNYDVVVSNQCILFQFLIKYHWDTLIQKKLLQIITINNF